MTTKKSIRFQLSARYALGWPRNPVAVIFISISTQNKARNTGSEASTAFPRAVSANPGALLSIARNTQFSAMTPMTTRSK